MKTGQNSTQAQRLDYLVEEFKTDSGEYKDLVTPSDTSGKQRLLRSLMNIRMPGKMSAEVIKVQDAYLKERAEEKGIVYLSDIPKIRDGLSIWQASPLRRALPTAESGLKSGFLTFLRSTGFGA